MLLSCVGMLQARRHETTHVSLFTVQVVVIEVHRLCIAVFAVLCLADYGKFNIGSSFNTRGCPDNTTQRDASTQRNVTRRDDGTQSQCLCDDTGGA